MNDTEHVVTIGGSAGAIDALLRLLGRLPADLQAGVCVTVHVSPTFETRLAETLQRATPLKCVNAVDNLPIRPGQVVLAPPDYHLLVRKGSVRLSHGPREHSTRPAIDPLFRTAAVAYGSAATGVLLSGWLDDGAMGLRSIQRCGGVTMIQSPQDAATRQMPEAGLLAVTPDFVLPAGELGDRLAEVVSRPPGPGIPVPPDLLAEDQAEEGMLSSDATGDDPAFALGRATTLICPDCGGPIRDLGDRYRCRVGHAFSRQTLSAAQERSIEIALWSSVRQMEAHAGVLRRLAEDSRAADHQQAAVRYDSRRKEIEDHARTIRRFLLRSPK